MSQTESVKYLIDAEDRATNKVRKSKEEVKKMVGEVRDLGEKSKASSELVGTLAAQLGNTGAGAAAGEVAQLIERVSAFSSVAKDGGKGAMFLKAGIAAAVGVIAVKFGQAIGNAIFQTEKWRREFKRTVAAITEDSGRLNATISKRFGRSLELVNTITDEAERKDSLAKMLKRAQVEAKGAASNVENLQKKIAEMENDSIVGFQTENHKAMIEADKERLKNFKAIRDTRRQQLDQLRDMTSPAAENLRLAKERFEQVKKSEDAMAGLRQQLDLAKATGKDRLRIQLEQSGIMTEQLDLAVKLKTEADELIRKEKEAQDARKKAVEERRREEERISGIYSTNINSLKEQLIGLTKNKAAANAFKLEMAGVAKEDAKFLGGLKDRIDKLNKAKQQSSIPTGANDADTRRVFTQSRSSFAKKAEDLEAKRQSKIQEEMAAALKQLVQFEKSKKDKIVVKQHGK